MKFSNLTKAICLGLIFTSFSDANAQWAAKPTPNTLVNGTGLGSTDQKFADITAYNSQTYQYGICWQDRRAGLGQSDIYGQCFDSAGNVQWGSNGLLISNATGAQQNSRIVMNNADGYYYIAWEDLRNGNSDIFIQKVSPAGVVQWTSNGVAVTTACNTQSDIEMVALSGGGVVITWVDQRNGTQDIYAQKFNGSGTAQWATNGLPVCVADGIHYNQKIVGNVTNGFAIVWAEDNGAIGSQNIYGQKLDVNGDFKWSNSLRGKLLCSSGNYRFVPKIVESGTDDYFIAWLQGNGSGGNSEPYYMKIDQDGAPLTSPSTGIQAYTNSSSASARYIEIISDRNDGIYMVWDDIRNADYDIYAQHIDNTGATTWTAAGVRACNNSSDQFFPRVAACGSTLFMTWVDKRAGGSTPNDLYYQSIALSTGNLGYGTAGVALSNKARNQQNQRMTIMYDKVVTVWDDYENSSHIDVFCSQMYTQCTTVTTTSLVVMDPTTSVDPAKIKEVAQFRVYPNPVSNELIISHPVKTSISTITILSPDGKVVKEIQDFKTGSSINVSELAAGNYIIRFSGSDETSTFKIVKQ
jgi:hypothetical protein